MTLLRQRINSWLTLVSSGTVTWVSLLKWIKTSVRWPLMVGKTVFPWVEVLWQFVYGWLVTTSVLIPSLNRFWALFDSVCSAKSKRSLQAANVPGKGDQPDEVVRSHMMWCPGEFVISAYAPCADVTKTVTPGQCSCVGWSSRQSHSVVLSTLHCCGRK